MSVPGKIGNYRIASALGESPRVKTFLAFRGTDTNPKLLKLYTLDSMEQEDITNTLFEIQVLASIRHPYILNYYEAFLEEEQRALVVATECCEEGSLHSLLERVYQRDTSAIDLLGEKIKQMFCQIVLALREINRYNLVHRNINPKDIFIDEAGNVKLGGFERCKLQTVAPTEISVSAYPGYSAPETFELDKYTIRSDIWSMGIVFYELLYFGVPFQSPDLQTLIGFIKNSKLEPPKDPQLSGELEDLVGVIPKLLRKHPLQRLTVDNLLALKSLNSEFKQLFSLHPELASSERQLGQPERLLPGVEIKTPGQIPSNFNKQLRQLRKLRVLNVLEGKDDLEDAGVRPLTHTPRPPNIDGFVFVCVSVSATLLFCRLFRFVYCSPGGLVGVLCGELLFDR